MCHSRVPAGVLQTLTYVFNFELCLECIVHQAYLTSKMHNILMYTDSTDQKKVDDARKAKEIRQLQKESRKRDNKIRTLESDARRRELVLKRRQEEVS